VNSRIGIMQGRLSPRPADRLQAFPHSSWQGEFDAAARLGISAIEWIFEADRVEANPLVTADGRAEIQKVVRESGVAVRSVCADYFMIHRLAGEGRESVRKNRAALRELIDATHAIGAERILIPLLETSAVDTPEQRREVQESLAEAAPHAEDAGVVLGLELEIPGAEYRALIDGVGHRAVKAYYDVGNSTAKGFDVASDVRPLLDVLHAVHLKDRKIGGGSVPLGTGDANFLGFLRGIGRHGFSGDLLMQSYFDQDPVGQARDALAFVRATLERARSSS
jgi:hexulose-6-phosphate isomerase